MDRQRKALIKAEIRGNNLEARAKDLELQLAQAKRENTDRSASLEAREHALEEGERRLRTEQEQLANAQELLQTRERQMLQERVLLNKIHALKNEDLATREEKLAEREKLLKQKSEALIQQTSSHHEAIPVALITGPSVTDSSPSTIDIGLVGTTADSSSSHTAGSIKHIPSPTIRRIAGTSNLRAQVLPSPVVPSSRIPIRTCQTIISKQKVRSDGDLPALVLAASTRSNIPVASVRIHGPNASKSQEPREAYKTKKTVAKKKADASKVSVAPPVSSPAKRVPRYQLRSAAKALKNAAPIRL